MLMIHRSSHCHNRHTIVTNIFPQLPFQNISSQKFILNVLDLKTNTWRQKKNENSVKTYPPKVFSFPLTSANDWVARNRIPLVCSKGSGIATGQTTQIATKKCMAKSCFGVQKMNFLREFSVSLQPFYQKRIKAILVRGKCKFLFKWQWNMC